MGGATTGSAPVFVHFIPLPLRAEGKKGLPWIVHTCDGSPCAEADHVNFKTLIGFETYEGTPPEQTCNCTVSKHHLRGHGRVRWEGSTAVIECADEDENRLVNVASFRSDAKRQAREIGSMRTETRRLREEHEKSFVATGQLKARVTELERTKMELETAVREGEVFKKKYSNVLSQQRSLTARCRELEAVAAAARDGVEQPSGQQQQSRARTKPRRVLRRTASKKGGALDAGAAEKGSPATDEGGADADDDDADGAGSAGARSEDEEEVDMRGTGVGESDELLARSLSAELVDHSAHVDLGLEAAGTGETGPGGFRGSFRGSFRGGGATATRLSAVLGADSPSARAALRRHVCALILAATGWHARQRRRQLEPPPGIGGAKSTAVHSALRSPSVSVSSSSASELWTGPAGPAATGGAGAGGSAVAFSCAPVAEADAPADGASAPAARPLAPASAAPPAGAPMSSSELAECQSNLRALLTHTAQQVCVLTARARGRRIGVTVSSVTCCSMTPPMVSLNVAVGSRAEALLVGEAGRATGSPFSLHVLAEGSSSLARHFARRGMSDAETFGPVAWTLSTSGLAQPVLLDSDGGAGAGAKLDARVQGTMECAAEQAMLAGDHWVLTARVCATTTAEALGAPPLVYHARAYGSVRREAEAGTSVGGMASRAPAAPSAVPSMAPQPALPSAAAAAAPLGTRQEGAPAGAPPSGAQLGGAQHAGPERSSSKQTAYYRPGHAAQPTHGPPAGAPPSFAATAMPGSGLAQLSPRRAHALSSSMGSAAHRAQPPPLVAARTQPLTEPPRQLPVASSLQEGGRRLPPSHRALPRSSRLQHAGALSSTGGLERRHSLAGGVYAPSAHHGAHDPVPAHARGAARRSSAAVSVISLGGAMAPSTYRLQY